MIFNENITFKDLSTTKEEDLKEEEDIEVGPMVAQQASSRPTQTIGDPNSQIPESFEEYID